jgi:hypothetical protein
MERNKIWVNKILKNICSHRNGLFIKCINVIIIIIIILEWKGITIIENYKMVLVGNSCALAFQGSQETSYTKIWTCINALWYTACLWNTPSSITSMSVKLWIILLLNFHENYGHGKKQRGIYLIPFNLHKYIRWHI